MSSCVIVDNKVKDILIIGEGATQGLDDSTLITEAKYSVNFTQPTKIFVLNVHYNGSNCFLFVNDIKIYQFKAKDSEIKYHTLYLGSISKVLKIKSVFSSIQFDHNKNKQSFWNLIPRMLNW